MDIFDTRYYKLNKRLLALVGMWPYQSRNSKLINRFFIIFSMFTFYIPMVFKFVTMEYSLEMFVEITSYAIIVLVVVIKYLSYWCNADHVRYTQIMTSFMYIVSFLNKMFIDLTMLYEEMQRDWDLQKNKEDLKIMHDTAEEGRKYCFGVFVYTATGTAIFNLSVFIPKILDILMPLEEPRPFEFLIQAEYFVDPNKYYYHISLHMILCISVVFAMLLATDTMYMTHVHYACGLFSIAGYHMKELFNGTLTDKEISYRISYVVHYHRKAMRFVNALNTIHEWEFIVTLGLITANISLSLYFVVSVMDMSFQTLKAVTSVLGQMCHLFIDIYAAQKIINISFGLCQYVYNSKWYIASANNQKLILMIMSACIIPSHIMPVGLFVLSVETYSSIVQTAVSYFTVLHSVNS